MNVSQKASNCAVLGDCGRYPLLLITWKQVIKYWLKVLRMSNDRHVKKCYDMLLYFDTLGYNNWASVVKHILAINGFMYIWNDQNVENEAAFMRAFDERI